MKEYIHTGFGFPVTILNPKMIKVFGEPVLDVNTKQLQQLVFEFLLGADFRLSGAHVKFIRHVMGLTQAKLAELLWQANHSCVSQWEAKEHAPAGMEAGTEKLLKIMMANHLNNDILMHKIFLKQIPKASGKRNIAEIKLKVA